MFTDRGYIAYKEYFSLEKIMEGGQGGSIDGQMTEKEFFSAAVSLRSVYAAFRVLRRCM